jgi:hypothetical protein
MKSKLADILAKYTIPVCGYAPGILQVFYMHGGLSESQAAAIFSNLQDYAMDGTGSGPSFFLRKI